MLLERQALGPGLGVSWLQGRALGTENPRQVPLGTQVPLCMDAGLTLTQGTVKAAATVLGLSGGEGGPGLNMAAGSSSPMYMHAHTHTHAYTQASITAQVRNWPRSFSLQREGPGRPSLSTSDGGLLYVSLPI